MLYLLLYSFDLLIEVLDASVVAGIARWHRYRQVTAGSRTSMAESQRTLAGELAVPIDLAADGGARGRISRGLTFVFGSIVLRISDGISTGVATHIVASCVNILLSGLVVGELKRGRFELLSCRLGSF